MIENLSVSVVKLATV